MTIDINHELINTLRRAIFSDLIFNRAEENETRSRISYCRFANCRFVHSRCPSRRHLLQAGPLPRHFTLSQITTGANTVLFGNMYAMENPRTARYSIPIAGSLEPVPASNPSVKRLGLHGVNVSVHWGNHSDCSFAFDVNPPTLAPATPAVISCDGRTPGDCNATAAMAKVDCAMIHSAASALADGGRPLGD
jgi:hypothetical protein